MTQVCCGCDLAFLNFLPEAFILLETAGCSVSNTKVTAKSQQCSLEMST